MIYPNFDFREGFVNIWLILHFYIHLKNENNISLETKEKVMKGLLCMNQKLLILRFQILYFIVIYIVQSGNEEEEGENEG